MKSGKGEKRGYLFGALIGTANGFFGGGGGMIAVPILKKVMGLPDKKAHATAIFIILPLTLISAICYLSFGVFPKTGGIYTAVGVFAGGTAGAKLLGKLPQGVVETVFILAMACSGIYMLFR